MYEAHNLMYSFFKYSIYKYKYINLRYLLIFSDSSMCSLRLYRQAIFLICMRVCFYGSSGSWQNVITYTNIYIYIHTHNIFIKVNFNTHAHTHSAEAFPQASL